eukprot:5768727-Karenia_brevis.AAC.1
MTWGTSYSRPGRLRITLLMSHFQHNSLNLIVYPSLMGSASLLHHSRYGALNINFLAIAA